MLPDRNQESATSRRSPKACPRVLSTALLTRDFLQLLRKAEVAPQSQEADSLDDPAMEMNEVSVYLSVSSKDILCIPVSRDTK